MYPHDYLTCLQAISWLAFNNVMYLYSYIPLDAKLSLRFTNLAFNLLKLLYFYSVNVNIDICVSEIFIFKHRIPLKGPLITHNRIATDYGLDGPRSNPDEDEIFRPSRPALEPTQPPVQWVEAAGAWGWPPPHLVPKVLENSRAIPLLTLRACVAYKKGKNLPT